MGSKLAKSIDPHKVTPGPGYYEDMRQSHYNNLTGSKMGKDNRISDFLLDPTHKMPEPGMYNQVNFAA